MSLLSIKCFLGMCDTIVGDMVYKIRYRSLSLFMRAGVVQRPLH